MEVKPWAALRIEEDGAVAVYIHNWLLIGRARDPDGLWKLVQEGWHKPEEFWKLFYADFRRSSAAPTSATAGLSFEDLGI